MKFILGTKEYMTQFFTEDGKVHPATVVTAGPVTVTQVKTKGNDGYEAVALGFGTRNAKNINMPQRGAWKDLGNFRFVRECRTDLADIKIGDIWAVAENFAAGDEVVVTGTSKGKGFQGVVKRHGFAGGRRSHGQKHSEREPGSIGAGGVQRVIKGMRMGGRMGTDRISVKGLTILAVNPETNQLIIKGAVPGRKGTLLEIVKNG